MSGQRGANRMIFRRVAVSLLTVILLLAGLGGQAWAAGLLIADNGSGGVLEIVEHEVKVTINNGVAVTEVTQVFRNTEQRPVEALYTFPVPGGASVANFSMWINGKEMVGEVLEKKKAREIYDSYKQQRRDPGLLEQKDYKTFEMRIFPIAPEARQKVQITYCQELNFDHDRATYVYPLATTADRQNDNRVRGHFAVNVQVKSAVPINAFESPSHGGDFLMLTHSAEYREASLEKKEGDLARDVVLAFQVTRPVTGLDLLTSVRPGEDGYFALTLRAGSELEKSQSGSDYVFILDISGSMADDGKLRSSVNSLAAFVTALGPEDRFEIITFNRVPQALFNKLLPAEGRALQQAGEFLKTLEARGGTALEPALGAAYRYSSSDRTLNTVIMSDGLTEQAETTILLRMIRNRPAKVRVFCIGVGNEINRSLLSQMAEDAGGLAAFLSQGDDFQKQARAFRRKLMHPVAENLAIRITGIDTYDLTPAKTGNLYFGMPLRLYGRFKGAGSGRVELTGEVNGRRVTTVVELDFPKNNPDNPEIERMWAWQRMEELKRAQDAAADPRLIEEIVRLGETYSITSEYTSFLVLENDAEYQRWKIERRNVERLQRDRQAQAKVREQLEVIRGKAMQELGPVTERPRVAPENLAPPPSGQLPRPAPQPPSGRQPVPAASRSTDLPSFGGGAMDPFSGLIGIFLAGGAFFARRKNK